MTQPNSPPREQQNWKTRETRPKTLRKSRSPRRTPHRHMFPPETPVVLPDGPDQETVLQQTAAELGHQEALEAFL